MRVLAVDTTTTLGSTAIVDAQGIVVELSVGQRRRHGEFLMSDIERVFELAHLSLSDIGLLAVGLGPGSFTGLRVGLASIKGLALSTGLPVVGVGSLEAVAAPILAANQIAVPILDGSKGEVFAAAYIGRPGGWGEERVAPFHAPPGVVGPRLREVIGSTDAVVAGGGYRRYRDELSALLPEGTVEAPPIYDSPRASQVASLAIQRFQKSGADDVATLEPRYLRGSDAKLPSPSGGSSAP